MMRQLLKLLGIIKTKTPHHTGRGLVSNPTSLVSVGKIIEMTPFSQIKSVQTHFPAVNTPEIHLFATSFTFINR